MKLRLDLYLKELLLFGATIAIGIFSVYQNTNSSAPLMAPDIKFGWGDIVFLAVLALFFIFSSKYKKMARFSFKLFLILITFSGTSLIMSMVLRPPWDIWATFFVLAAFLLIKNVLVHNIAIILAVAGIGSLLGLTISPGTAVLAMVVLSFYDIIAVYVSGHMIRMAKTMMESGAVFGFIIPSKVNGFFYDKNKAQSEMGLPAHSEERFMILGSGDIGLPVVLVGSVARYSIGEAIAVAIFSLIGLFLTHLIFVNQGIFDSGGGSEHKRASEGGGAPSERKPMAALPPIATMSTIGYLLTVII